MGARFHERMRRPNLRVGEKAYFRIYLRTVVGRMTFKKPESREAKQRKATTWCYELLQPAFLMNWLECRRSKTAICHDYIAEEWEIITAS